MKDLVFHHIGYATNSIKETSSFYLERGYKASEIIYDEVQQTNICFLTKVGNPTIELIEPATEKSSIHKILKKNGVHPYHCCYEVEDIEKSFDQFAEDGFTPLFRPVEAIALDNRLICYFYRSDVGFIELLNKL